MKYLTRTKETAQRWFISGLKGENTDNVFYTGSEGEPWSPRLHPIFFSLPDAENEEAVRRQTCCVAVALGAFRFTNTSCFIFNHSFIEIIPPSFAVALTTYRAPSYRMWNYWCIQPPTQDSLLLLLQHRQISFFGLLGKSRQRRRVKMFSIKCDWIGFYKMNCPDRGLSQLHCREVPVPPQPLRSAAIRVDFELLGSVIVSPAYCVSWE